MGSMGKIHQFFDTVLEGVSDALTFFAKILTPIEEVLGQGDPIAKGLAQGLTLLQQAVADVKLTVNGVESPLVMTSHIYNSVVGFVQGWAAAYKGASIAQMVPVVLKDLEKGIPVALDILQQDGVAISAAIGPNGEALIKISEEVLSVIVPLILAGM